MDQVGGNFSFDKGKKLDFENFNGVSKESLLKKVGDNPKRKALIESLFAKYDNGDGIMSKAEFGVMQKELGLFAKDNNLGGRELKRFNQNLGADKKAYNMEDLQAVIGNMTDGTDGIVGVNETENGLQIVYDKNAEGQQVTENFVNENNKLILESDVVVDSNNVTTSTVYINGDKNKIAEQAVHNDNNITITKFAEDGKTVTSRSRLSGGVEEVLDFEHNDRVLTKTINIGQDVVETVDYEYADTGINPSKETLTKPDGTKFVTEFFDDDVLTVTKLNPQGKPAVVINMKGDEVLSEEEYTYDEQGNITIVKTEGENDDAVKTKTVTNADGKITQRVNVDSEGNTVPLTHTVKPTDTWYGIVQAKYDIKDHKTTMEIVHKLKTENGVKFSQKTMPETINLLPTIDLGSGRIFEIKDVAAESDPIHSKSLQERKQYVKESKNAPAKEAAKPEEAPKAPAQEAAKPEEAPKAPAKEAAKPEEAPKAPAQEAVKPEEAPKAPAQEAAKPDEAPKAPAQETAKPDEAPKAPAQEAAKPEEAPKAHAQEAVKPDEAPKAPAKEAAKPEEAPKAPAKEAAKPEEAPKTSSGATKANKPIADPAKLPEFEAELGSRPYSSYEALPENGTFDIYNTDDDGNLRFIEKQTVKNGRVEVSRMFNAERQLTNKFEMIYHDAKNKGQYSIDEIIDNDYKNGTSSRTIMFYDNANECKMQFRVDDDTQVAELTTYYSNGTEELQTISKTDFNDWAIFDDGSISISRGNEVTTYNQNGVDVKVYKEYTKNNMLSHEIKDISGLTLLKEERDDNGNITYKLELSDFKYKDGKIISAHRVEKGIRDSKPFEINSECTMKYFENGKLASVSWQE